MNPESLPIATTLDAQWQLAREAREAEQRDDYGTAFLALLALIIGKKMGTSFDEPRPATGSHAFERSFGRYERSLRRFENRK